MRFAVVGFRGLSYVDGLRTRPEVEIVSLCELDRPRAEAEAAARSIPKVSDRFDEALDECDAIVLGTPMHLHAPQAIQALEQGKHVLCEVTAAVSAEECYRLARAARASRALYCMSENYLHFPESALVLELVRRGMFGEPYFAEGEYLHEVRNLHRLADGQPSWRARWQVGVRGCTYGTHSLGPAMRWMRALCPGDRIESVSCVGTGAWTAPEHPQDDTSLMLCQLASGKLVKVRLDMISNRPHQIYYSLQGTRGAYESGRSGGLPVVWFGESEPGGHREWRPLSDFDDLLPAGYREARGGHGGGDFHVGRLFAQAVLDGGEPDVGIRDAFEWTMAGLCAQQSILESGSPVRMPAFPEA